jgi:hypothetical protein
LEDGLTEDQLTEATTSRDTLAEEKKNAERTVSNAKGEVAAADKLNKRNKLVVTEMKQINAAEANFNKLDKAVRDAEASLAPKTQRRDFIYSC